jgi:hypothetical protein
LRPLRVSLSGCRIGATGEALSAAAKAALVVVSQTRVADMIAGSKTVFVIGWCQNPVPAGAGGDDVASPGCFWFVAEVA